MSEFEEWWREQSLYIQENVNKKALELAYVGGKEAALEWVLNHPDLIDHYQLDYVKKELEKLK